MWSGPGPQVPDVSYEDAVSFEQYGRSFMWAMTATTGMGFNIDPQTMLQTSARPPAPGGVRRLVSVCRYERPRGGGS